MLVFLAAFVLERRKLVDEKTAQTNHLTNHLKIYFPQMLDWFERLDTDVVCALLECWPRLGELQKVPPAKLRPSVESRRLTESSGKKKWVHVRWACSKFLRQSFHEWTGHSIAHSNWARAYYQRHQQTGRNISVQ